MCTKMNFYRLLLILPIVFIASLLVATRVFADDGPLTPPVPVFDPLPVTPADTAPVIVEQTAPTDPAPEAPVADPVQDPLPVQQVDAAPVIPVDPADQALLTGGGEVDPYFTVGLTTYTFTPSDCDPLGGVTPCSNPLQAAVDYIRVHALIPTDGFIHVEAGTLNNQGVTVDGSLPNLNSLKGITGHLNPVTLAPDAILANTVDPGSYIYVTNKTNGFTISSLGISSNPLFGPLTLYATVDFNGNSGPILLQDLVVYDSWSSGGSGIRVVNQNGTITLKNIRSNGNLGGGALLDNSLGTSPVTVTNSSFDGNTGSNLATGLRINSYGTVTLNGVSASNNTAGSYAGIEIVNSGTLSITNVIANGNINGGIRTGNLTAAITLKNVNADNNTSGSGLILLTKGNISLTNVSGSGNDNMGARLDTCNPSGGACTWLGTGTVTINGGTFDGNHNFALDGYGLLIVTRGAISLTNVSASDNNEFLYEATGAYLDTSQSQLISPVTINVGNFNNDRHAGLVVLAKGAITLKSTFASDSTFGAGAQLVNILGTAGVSVTGTSSDKALFFSNGGDGLDIVTKGVISINYVDASGNAGYGAALQNSAGTGGVTITNAIFNGNTVHDGLDVISKGAITLTNVTASTNILGFGAVLDNVPALSGMPITVKNGSFSGNHFDGLDIVSKGTITVNGVTAFANATGFGMAVSNTAGTGSVSVSNTSVSANHMDGLAVASKGAITLLNVDSDSSIAGNGVVIVNSAGTGSVSVTNVTVNANHIDGIDIVSKGAITMLGVSANSNVTGNGVVLVNSSGTAGVTVNGLNSNANHLTGLQVVSNGAIKVTSATANSNLASGIELVNNAASTAQPVSLTTSYANGNTLMGIGVVTKGTITLTSAYANGNGQNGAALVNSGFPLFTQPVIVNNAIFSSNGTGGVYDNLVILTNGSVTLASVVANSCATAGCSGLKLGDATPIAGSVTISKSTFNSNKQYGLLVKAKGNIKISGLTTSFNGGFGSWLENTFGSPANPVVSVANGFFDNNSLYGLVIYSRGSVTLTNIDASSNVNGNGAYVQSVNGGVSLLTTGSSINNFESNGGTHDGLDIDVGPLAAVVLNKVHANNNTGATGVYIGTLGDVGNVTVNGGEFRNNFYGLAVHSVGTILINGAIANDNSLTGLYLLNFNDHSGLKGITINKAETDHNFYGVWAMSWGLITVNNGTANNNLSVGYYLDNGANNTSTFKGITVLNSLGPNTFSNNVDYGLYLITRGNMNITGVTADDNGHNGILADESGVTSPSGTLTLTNITTRYNGYSGIYASVYGVVKANLITSLYNSPTHSWDGISIYAHNHAVTISNSVFMENGSSGIYAIMGGPASLTLTNLIYFGNMTFTTSFGNLYVTH